MPAQPVHDAGAVGDEGVAMVRDEPDLHRLLVQIGEGVRSSV
jgi:outer membrane usher protein FimD/PapC